MPLSNGQKNKILQFASTRARLNNINLQKPEGFQELLVDVVEQLIEQFEPADVISAYRTIKANTNAALIADLEAQKVAADQAKSRADAEIAEIRAED